MPERIELADGYYTVPPGKLVNAVTWLEMLAPPSEPLAAPLRLQSVGPDDAERCRALFQTIGTPWLWSRVSAGLAGEADESSHARDTHFALHHGEPVGIVEFEGRNSAEVEITWFGLVPAGTGRGLGRRMLAAALQLAWAGSPRRVWLHTCNFDHPGAIRFYQACGFVPYATGFEIMDDPRLRGALPRTAAPHVPLIERR